MSNSRQIAIELIEPILGEDASSVFVDAIIAAATKRAMAEFTVIIREDDAA